MKKKYQSELLMVLNEIAVDLHDVGVLSDDEMHESETDCLSLASKGLPKAPHVPAEPPMVTQRVFA